MGLFDKMKEPVFLKESSEAEMQLEKLSELEPLLNPEGQAKIRQDIKCLEYGIAGEKNIAFELKNSHMPMYILHDIYLECGDLSAQIDYLVFTRKICFVIECKNLYGDIEINNTGDFVRTIEIGGKKKKEGIYSPITQNQRHLELMKKVKVDKKNNILTKFMLERYFDDFYKSVVVLANPKTVLNAKYAKKEVKEKVIRTDQLVSYIKEMYKQSKESGESDERLLSWANSYLELHKEVEKNYINKYDSYKIGENLLKPIEAEAVTEAAVAISAGSIEDSEIFQELKAYRLMKSREEKIKPYYIYNDNQLKDLIIKMPRKKEELTSVAGFGEAKVNKYGDDILKILGKY
ncbi:HRDC domain-containing protein [Anaerocolumna xylanovorans]|uniref:HRDC domain-containing protein n=1 Tax=Anaerocolumna xylanovorans DSM 12503 TaxID=1121345 RepID=A0A1M7XYR4_9FIRM|nr:HRDC domain-containing protein [Anaerocolumna xylanovorans]SHO44093.1 HRDC domain-containing protein [Anaerocolumna xylanovorans DSM 12503]